MYEEGKFEFEMVSAGVFGLCSPAVESESELLRTIFQCDRLVEVMHIESPQLLFVLILNLSPDNR